MAVVFLLLFTAYYVNSTMFWHSHIINGECVQHSHIHVQHHHNSLDGGHTTPQLLLIHTLNETFLYVCASCLFFLVAPEFKRNDNCRQLIQSCRLGHVQYAHLRAPPFVF